MTFKMHHELSMTGISRMAFNIYEDIYFCISGQSTIRTTGSYWRN